MTINLTAVGNNQLFGTWLTRTNDMIYAFGANVVTVDTTANASWSTGNGYVNGMFGANTLYATYISGGNVATNTVLTITSNVAITSNSILSVGNSSMNIISGFLSTNPSLLEGYGNQNNYVQFALTNSNTGTNASADFAIYDSSGLAGYNFIGMGILGSGFSNTTWTIGGGSDGYLYTGNTNLAIGTAGQKYINFFANGTLTTNEVMRITSGANVGIGNTNPNARLQVTGTANVSANMHIGGIAYIVGNTFIGGFANVAGNANIAGNTYIGGNVYINSVANVIGNSTFSANLTVIGELKAPTIVTNTSIAGVMAVNSASVNVSVDAYFQNNLTIAGNTYIGGNANVIGNSTFSANLTVIGQLKAPTIVTNTSIAGVMAVNSASVNVSVNAYFQNNLTIVGNLNVSGNVVQSGSSVGNLNPVDSSYYLGQPTLQWSMYGNTIVVSNTLTISNTSVIISNTYSYGSSANAVIDQFVAATYRSAEYLIQASNSTAYQVSKVLVVHDGTTAYATEYAIVNSAAQMLTLGVTKAVSNVQLWSVPVDATVVVKFTRTNLVV